MLGEHGSGKTEPFFGFGAQRGSDMCCGTIGNQLRDEFCHQWAYTECRCLEDRPRLALVRLGSD
ncbi:hypothetical protein GCM10027033_28640 [Leucobacter ruminantium]